MCRELYKTSARISIFFLELGTMISSISLKANYLNAFVEGAMNQEDREKMYAKCREFFITFMLQYIIDMIIQISRHHVEQGNLIRIGTIWDHGGADEFARYYRYNDPNFRINEGDFSAMDTSIRLNLIQAYSMGSVMYIDFTQMTRTDIMIYKSLLRWSAEHLSVKLCRVVDTLWIIIFGILPSGAYCTSHAGSWIVAWLLCSYVAECIANPKGGRQIQDHIDRDLLRIGVYGDDHIISTHVDISQYVNEKGFSEYVARVHGMLIKKNSIKIGQGLTELDINHTMVRKGAVFLRKRIVRTSNLVDYESWPPGVAEFVAIRNYRDYYDKVCYGPKRKDFYDTAAALIGLAYDNSGVCLYTHQYLYMMYVMCRQATADAMFPKGVIRAIIMSSDVTVKKYLFRKGKVLNDITGEFPDLDTLRNRHVKNKYACKRLFFPHHYAAPPRARFD